MPEGKTGEAVSALLRNGVNVVVIREGELIKELMKPWESKLKRNKLIMKMHITVRNGLRMQQTEHSEDTKGTTDLPADVIPK